ncbi:MAG TPA: T9SS type A sorting domain-containing protein [Candidatus Scalindua sp.]|nr:T9SS type A sorting domain-containing protein [Candidatus Scalindua sp.]
MKRYTIVFATLAVLYSTSVFAQPEPVWMQTFTFGGQTDIPLGLTTDGYGNFIANGHKEVIGEIKAALAKFSQDGEMLWITLDSSDVWTSSGFNHVAITNVNRIAWYTGKWFDSGGLLTTYNTDGAPLWQQESENLLYLTDYNDMIVAVTLSDGGDSSQALFIDSEGIFQRSFPIADLTTGIVTPNAHGNHLWVSALFYRQGVVNVDGFIAKYNITTGELLWRWELEDAVKVFSTVDGIGNSYFTASQATNDTNGFLRYILVKLDPNGNVLWQNEWFGRDTYETNYENYVNGVVVSDTHKRVVVYGVTQKGDIHDGSRSNYVVGFDTNTGDSLWVMRWEYSSTAIINQINGGVFDSSGSLILLGNTYTGGDVSNKGYLQKWSFTDTTVNTVENRAVPINFTLHQNYPNPFNPSTTIAFELSERTLATLIVYNVLGRQVAELVNEMKMSGRYEVVFSGQSLSSGTYLYRLTTNNTTETKKMVLLK